MAAGAPQDVIDELLKRYNEAMQRYVQALQANPDAAQSQPPLPPDAKMLGMNDVQTLLKMIQQLTTGRRPRTGGAAAGGAAVHAGKHAHDPGQAAAAARARRTRPATRSMQKFGDLMGKQRQLLDKTFRQKQGQADPKDGGAARPAEAAAATCKRNCRIR